MTKRIFILTDGPLAPQAQFEAIAGRLEADIRGVVNQTFKQQAHIDEIKRLCHAKPRGT